MLAFTCCLLLLFFVSCSIKKEIKIELFQRDVEFFEVEFISHMQGPPFKATTKYLPIIKYCLKPFQPVLKPETLTVRAVMGVY